MKSIKFFIILFAAVTLAACGSEATIRPVAYKTATLSFRTISSAHSAPLQGIQMTVKLPQGATVTDVTKAVTGRTGQLDAGSLSYSTADNTVTFSVTDVSSIKLGPAFADLKCDIDPAYSLDAGSFAAANKPSFPFLEMTGVANGTSVNLVPEINIDMAVELQ